MRPFLLIETHLGLLPFVIFKRTSRKISRESSGKSRLKIPKKAKPRMSRFARHPHVRFAHKSMFLDG